jgi:large subunit ribosomal protein L1
VARRSKRFRELQKLVDKEKMYNLEEALFLLKETSNAKFDETVEISVKLGIDPRHAEQQVRSTVVLPEGTGKKVRIVVFAKGEKIREAEDAGADFVGGKDLVEKIQNGFLDFDVAIATPDVMRDVSKIGRILGPRGLMPNPKAGTVTFNIKEAIEEVKKGRIEFRADKYGIVHLPIGKASFPVERLMSNLKAVLSAIISAKPAAAKGQYIRSVYLSSTMGPGIRIDPKIAKRVGEEV